MATPVHDMMVSYGLMQRNGKSPVPTNGECVWCRSKGTTPLKTCNGCRIAKYCGQEHQIIHWKDNHKMQCTTIKKRRVAMEEAERELRGMEPSLFMPADLWENHIGHFWGLPDTRPFMRAKYAYVEGLNVIRSAEAIQEALNQCRDILRLNRSDNMGARYLIPSLLMRLHQDQEAYDFSKWYLTAGTSSTYDWGDMSLPFLDLKDENVFEDPEVLDLKCATSFAIDVTLIKLRLLFDLSALENSKTVASKVPQELLDQIRESLVGDIAGNNADIMNAVQDGKGISDIVKKVQGQLDELYEIVDKQNSHFWKAMTNPTAHLYTDVSVYSHGSQEQMCLFVQEKFGVWDETPGALAWVKEKQKKK